MLRAARRLAPLYSSGDRTPQEAIAVYHRAAASQVEGTTLVATHNVLKRGTGHSWLLAQNSADFIHKSAETACVVLRLLEQLLNIGNLVVIVVLPTAIHICRPMYIQIGSAEITIFLTSTSGLRGNRL